MQKIRPLMFSLYHMQTQAKLSLINPSFEEQVKITIKKLYLD